MKNKRKKEVSLLDFVKNGALDNVQIGQTKQWIFNNFCDPDEVYYTSEEAIYSIAAYGSLELHFERENDEELLFLIFSDGFNAVRSTNKKRLSTEFCDGKNLIFKKWIFDSARKLNLKYVIEVLLKNNIDFKTNTRPELSTIELRINNSKVVLHFETDEKNTDNSWSKFWCCAFWLGRD